MTKNEKAKLASELMRALHAGELETFKELIRARYEELNTDATLKRVGLSARTFYHSLGPDGNPSLKTLAQILKGLDL